MENALREALEDMARMFARMKLSTLIEDVESPEHVELIKSIPVDYIQDFYYAKPMNERDFIAFLEDNGKRNET